MLGPPSKRPTRVHPNPVGGGSGGVREDNQYNSQPSTPQLLRQQQQEEQQYAQHTNNYGAPNSKRHANSSRFSWQTIKSRFGVKSTIAVVLLIILLLLLLRHESRPRSLPRKPIQAFDEPAARHHDHGEHGEVEKMHDPVVPQPSESETKALEASHVHPKPFEWSHEKAVPERRPANFALNGEHPQYNEEKVTAIFERPRVAGLATPGLVTTFLSPTGRMKLSVLMSEDGRLGYMLDVRKPDSKGANAIYLPLLAPAFMELNANYQRCTFRTDNPFGAEVRWTMEFGESWWRPVPGNERRTFKEQYQQVKVWCAGKQCMGCNFLWEYRLYDHGMAIRAIVDGKSIEGFSLQPQADAETEYAKLDYGMEVRLPRDTNTVCWAQNAEDAYVKKTCSEWVEPVMTPITSVLDPLPASQLPTGTKPPVLPYKYISILQADGPAFMRSMGQTATDSPNTLNIITRGELPIHAEEHQLGVIEHPVMGWSTPTSWNVILVGESPQELVHHNSIIYLLCPPPSDRFPMTMDSRWVAHGKSIRARGHTTEKAKFLVDFAANFNYQMVHFDAGWYGDENSRSSDPRVIADEFIKDLNIATVAAYAKTRGIGVTVYVNEIALKFTNELIEIYPRWGLAGIKFGFVDVNSPKAMRILQQRIIAYQHVGMMVNVHDIYRPRGLTRTWPHLVTQEGVRGEERKPDATHHTILPFVRYLQGAADYTPRYLKGALRCTRAHQLALPFLFFSPIQSLFWAEPGQAISDAVQMYHPELIIWQMMPTTWDDTRVLAGSIGEYASIARRTGDEWFVGTITNTESRVLTLNLSSLFDNSIDGYSHPLPLVEQPLENKKGYMIHLYEDDPKSGGDLTVESNLNNVRVKLRQQFILPSKWSTEVHHWTKARALHSTSPFPNDPMPTHLANLQEYRRKVTVAQEKQLTKMYEKEGFKKGIPPPVVLDSPFIKVKLAPSGGHVMYITPIV